jgi:predicted RNase H-like nuclease (RuvC/YqgF family)
MKTKIAVATVNGRAYYELVTELYNKGLPFLSLKPWDAVPSNIKVVITTKEERDKVEHSIVLCYEQGSNAESVVDEAFLKAQGKQGYEKIVVGVDPGNSCGIAILGDSKVIETKTASSIQDAANLIVESVKRFPAETKIVRVGDGTPEYTSDLVSLLDRSLPSEVLVEIVKEAGTSQLPRKSVNRRRLKDKVSAIKIAGRTGQTYARK